MFAKLLKSKCLLRHVCLSVCLPARPSARPRVCPSARNNSAPAGRIVIQFYIWIFFSKICREKFKFHYNLTRITGALHEDICTFISSSMLLRMRNISDKSCGENYNKFYVQWIFFRKPFSLWDNVQKYGTAGQATDDNIIQRMPIVCWITKSTDTCWEYVILIAFPRKQWLRERASILRYTYTAYLVNFSLLTSLIWSVKTSSIQWINFNVTLNTTYWAHSNSDNHISNFAK